jgi:hypothetical protein
VNEERLKEIEVRAAAIVALVRVAGEDYESYVDALEMTRQDIPDLVAALRQTSAENERVWGLLEALERRSPMKSIGASLLCTFCSMQTGYRSNFRHKTDCPWLLAAQAVAAHNGKGKESTE